MTKAVYDAANVAEQLAGLTATQTLTNKTVSKAVIAGVPIATGELGRDTTQTILNYYDNGQLGTIPKVIAVGTGTQTFTNSTTADQDFTAIYTFPANTIFTNKVYRFTILYEVITGVSTVTIIRYIKLGATKIITSNATDYPNSVTRSAATEHYIFGRDAAGASQTISASIAHNNIDSGFANQTNQPVTGLATNGTLALTVGITYSGTGSTETMELQGWILEELN